MIAIPRNLTGLNKLHSADELVAFLRENPHDRILKWADDLSPDDFYESIAARIEVSILAVYSLKESGCNTIESLVSMQCRTRWIHYGCLSGEIATIAPIQYNHLGGPIIPGDIRKLLNDAEDVKPNRILEETQYEGIWVLKQSESTNHAKS